jgi:ribose 1,5-bisphosphokinase
VGPSGAGKDTLIRAARERLGPSYVFPQRTVTRPRDPLGEDHLTEDAESFAALEQAGAFMLSWRAHGLAYGVPASIAADLDAGRHVVVNVSREAVADARQRFAPVKVLLVTAPPDTLRERLEARKREGATDVAQRLARAPDVAADALIVNDGQLDLAIETFLAALKG